MMFGDLHQGEFMSDSILLFLLAVRALLVCSYYEALRWLGLLSFIVGVSLSCTPTLAG